MVTLDRNAWEVLLVEEMERDAEIMKQLNLMIVFVKTWASHCTICGAWRTGVLPEQSIAFHGRYRTDTITKTHAGEWV